MVSIAAEGLGLSYPVRQPISLRRRDRRIADRAQIVSTGRRQTVTGLSDLTFSLQAGDRLGLVGANGAGKTTLLKVLYGIYAPTEGSITTVGRVDGLFNLDLGFRAEATGRRNIVLRGLINGWSLDEIAARADDIIAFSELGDFIDLPFKTYSQGMAARLAFSIATSLEPEILLMDEWIAAGDAAFREKAGRRLDEIAAKAGIVVFASHEDRFLKRICNAIMELKAGRCTFFGSADEWFEGKEAPDAKAGGTEA